MSTSSVLPAAAVEEEAETTPLLPPPSAQPTSFDPADDPNRPLPKVQLLILCIARICEPFAVFAIFSFVQAQVHDLGIPEEDVGFWTGLIESLFSLVQLFLMIPWGRASDRFGRKPCLVVSLFGIAFAQVMFGLATSIWQLVLYRCLAGFFGGTVVTIRTMFSEISTQKTQARAFSYFAFASNLGIFFGPFIGGFFSNPAIQWPSLFGHLKLFQNFPYLLPCAITGAMCALSGVLCIFFLDETLKPEQMAKAKASGGTSVMEVLRSPGVVVILAVYTYVCSLGFAYTAVVPVFWFTPVHLGGYGLAPSKISLLFALAGISQSLWLLIVFPYIAAPHRLRISGVLKLTSWGWIVTLPLAPILNLVLKREWNEVFWVGVFVASCLSSGVAMSFTAAQLAVNNVSPSPGVLSTLNGIALSLTSAARFITPGLFGSIFATGVGHQILGGELIWAIMIGLAFGLVALLAWLPKASDGKIEGEDDTA